MDLPKKDKKVARDLIEKGLQKEFTNGLNSFHEILDDWKKGKSNNDDAYHKLYGSIKNFNKHIAQRYDAVTGSRYLAVVKVLLHDNLLSPVDLKAFSSETQKELERFLKIISEE